MLLPSFQALVVGEEHKLQDEEEEREKRLKLVNDVGEIIGYEFKDSMILQQAFTHYSYEEGCSSLGRLAYNGDAILSFAFTKEQYFLYPDLSPGDLTKLRAANVDTEKLARAALKHHLYNFLRHNISLLGEQIEEFRNAIGKYPLHSSGLVDAPKVLADIVESLIGALYIDSNSLDTTWEVVKRLLEPMITPEKVPIHPVTQLQEMCQRRRLKVDTRDESWKDKGVFEFVIHEVCVVGRAVYKPKRTIAKNRAALHAYNQILELLN